MMFTGMRSILALTLALPLLGKTPEWERAHALVESAQYKQAVQVLEKVSDKDADNLQLLGQAWFELKEYGKAIDALEKAEKLAPKSSTVQLWLGRAWGRLADEGSKLLAFGRARKTKAAFEKSVELDPKNMDALDDLYQYYFEAPGIVGGGLDKAEAVARRIAALDKPKGDELLQRVASERKK
jgi:tetratricopeptide (TPR) repeat protein